jgi:phosphoserine phosphatase RsbU/P
MQAAPSAAPTVLVADDSVFARRWAARLLAEAGHCVRTVGDGEHALSLVRAHPPDVLVADEVIARLSGPELVRAVRAVRADSGVVLTSASADAGVEAEALRLGADLFVPKPCSARALADAVGVALAAGEARRARREAEERNAGELRDAAVVQDALQPHAPALPPGWDLDAATLPSRDVGGDVHDVLVRDGRLLLVVGDVSGKGVAGALLAAMFQAAARSALGRGDDPATALSRAASQLHDGLERAGRFLTAVVVEVDLATGRVSYADAGHGHHLLLGPAGDRALDAGGPPAGFLPEPAYPLGTAEIPPGGCLALFTDGLVEGGPDAAAARPRLAAALGAGAVAARLVEGAPEDDDRTLLVLRREAA